MAEPSPVKGGPFASASREDLVRMLTDSAKKLKAYGKKHAELTAAVARRDERLKQLEASLKDKGAGSVAVRGDNATDAGESSSTEVEAEAKGNETIQRLENDVSALTKELADTERLRVELLEKIKGSEREKGRIEDQAANTVKAMEAKLEATLADRAKEQETLENQVTKLTESLTIGAQELEKTRNDLQQAEESHVASKTQLREISEALDVKEQLLRDKEQVARDLMDKVGCLEGKVDTLEATLGSVRSELEDAEARAKAAEDARSALHRVESDAQGELASLRKGFEEKEAALQSSVAHSEAQVVELTAQIEESSGALRAQGHELKAKLGELEAMEKEMNDLKQQLETRSTTEMELKGKLAQVHDEVATLQGAGQERAKEIDKLQQQLKSAEQALAKAHQEGEKKEAKSKDKVAKLQTQLKSVEDSLAAAAEKEGKQLEELRSTLSSELAKERELKEKREAVLKESIAKLQATSDEANARAAEDLERSRSKVAKLEEKLSQAEKVASDGHDLLKEKEASMQELEQKLAELEKLLGDSRESKEGELGEAYKRVEGLEKSLKEAQASLKSKVKALKKEKKDIESELRSATQKLQGEVETLSGLLQTEKATYEQDVLKLNQQIAEERDRREALEKEFAARTDELRVGAAGRETEAQQEVSRLAKSVSDMETMLVEQGKQHQIAMEEAEMRWNEKQSVLQAQLSAEQSTAAEAMSSQRLELEDSLHRAQEELKVSSIHKNELEGMVEGLRSEAEENAQRAMAAEAAKEKALQELASLQEDAKKYQTDHADVQRQFEALKQTVETSSVSKSDSEEMASRIADLESRLEEADAAVAKKQTDAKEVNAKLERLQKGAKIKVSQLNEEKSKLQEQLSEARDAAIVAESKCEKACQELESVQAKYEELSHELKGNKASGDQLVSMHESVLSELEQLKLDLNGKEVALAESRRLAAAKEQSLLELRTALDAAKEGTDDKVGKLSEELDAEKKTTAERMKALEASVSEAEAQRLTAVAELESKTKSYNDLESEYSGEKARLTAALEAANGEAKRKEKEVEAERERVKAVVDQMKKKVERGERARRKAEAQMQEFKIELEKKATENMGERLQVVEKLEKAQGEVGRLQEELRAYKVRAHALLKKKEDELSEALDGEGPLAHVQALEEEKLKVESLSAQMEELERIRQEDSRRHEEALQSKDFESAAKEHQLLEGYAKMEEALELAKSTVAEWQGRCEELERTAAEQLMQLKSKKATETERVQAAKADVAKQETLSEELEKLEHEKLTLKNELDSLREMTDSVMEAKDMELGRVLAEQSSLKKLVTEQQEVIIALRGKVAGAGVDSNLDDGRENAIGNGTDSDTLAGTLASAAAADEIRTLAAAQARREEELVSYRRQIAALETQVQTLDLEQRNAASEASKVQEELDNLRRQEGRANVDME
eukprot:scaffold1233_cov395-Prasinococcus_capsulatus_cf.AAC.24